MYFIVWDVRRLRTDNELLATQSGNLQLLNRR
jgi:hypothetical protein